MPGAAGRHKHISAFAACVAACQPGGWRTESGPTSKLSFSSTFAAVSTMLAAKASAVASKDFVADSRP